MGQFQGQPDFGTVATSLALAGAAAGRGSDTISEANNLNGACIYIGGPSPVANIQVILSGVVGAQGVGNSISVRTLGASYSVANGLAVIASSGEGTGLTVNITAVNASGGITGISITGGVAGTGYRQGDTLTVVQVGGSGGQIFINVIDSLPTAGDSVQFVGYPSGSFLPVIVDYVLATGTTATDIIAIY